MPPPRTVHPGTTAARFEDYAQGLTPGTRAADDDPLLAFASETKTRGARNIKAAEAAPKDQPQQAKPAATSVTAAARPKQEWVWTRVHGFAALAVGIVVIGLVAFQPVRDRLRSLAAEGQSRNLKVTSYPDGLQVAVDGNFIGVTPVTLPVTPGTHSVAVRLRGTQRVVPVVVTANADVSQHFEMKADDSSGQHGSLLVETDPPGAQVKIDGVTRGVSPLTIPNLTPTKHTITVAGNRGTVQRSVVVQPRATTSVVFALSQ